MQTWSVPNFCHRTCVLHDCVKDLKSEVISFIYRFRSGSVEGWQLGDLLAVRWITTSSSQHTVQVTLRVVLCLLSLLNLSYNLFCPAKEIWHNNGIILGNTSVADSQHNLIFSSILHSCQLCLLFYFCRRRTTVKMLCIYADYKSDESYTPSKISVRVGNNFHNLQEIRVISLSNIAI